MNFRFLAIVLLCSPLSLAAQEIYLSTLNGLLYSFDLSDCSFQQIGVMPVSSTDISFHPNGNLYCVTSGGELYEIDPMSGSSAFLHEFDLPDAEIFTALTISAEGIFYAAGLFGALCTYDLATDTGTFQGNMGTGAEGDLTFFDGNLYMAAENDNIVQVDIDNPPNSFIIINGNVPGNIFGIVSYAESCEDISVYALTDDNANIYEVNFEDNTLDFYCNTTLNVSGGASTTEFLGSNPVFIDDLIVDGFNCGQDDGSIIITASGGVGALTYSLDGVNYQPENSFGDLPLMTYTVYVTDEVGCVRTQEIVPDADAPIFTEVRITNTTCENDNGRIEVTIENGVLPYEFFVNGMLVSGFVIEDLPEGTYQLEVVDAAGCSVTTQASIGGVALPTVANSVVTATSCGEDNGGLSFTIAGGVEPFSFSLNGGTAQNNGNFSGLAPGAYTLTLIDQAGCTATATETILPSSRVEINSLGITDALCGAPSGALSVSAVGGQIPLSYRLNDEDATVNSEFSDLPGGTYVLRVTDVTGCASDTTVTLNDTPPVSLTVTGSQSAECLSADGSVSLVFSGGTGVLELRQNAQNILPVEEVDGLAAGTYRFTLMDELGCTDTTSVIIAAGNCPIYLPNVFSPNNDGTNDFFEPLSVINSTTEVLRMEVYDRWGGQVFLREAGFLGDPQYRWDGTRLDREMPAGYYVYFLEVRYDTGVEEVLSGEVLLLK